MRSTLFNISSPFCTDVSSFFFATAVMIVTFPEVVLVVVVVAEFYKIHEQIIQQHF